jgi:hypothetical protein
MSWALVKRDCPLYADTNANSIWIRDSNRPLYIQNCSHVRSHDTETQGGGGVQNLRDERQPHKVVSSMHEQQAPKIAEFGKGKVGS